MSFTGNLGVTHGGIFIAYGYGTITSRFHAPHHTSTSTIYQHLPYFSSTLIWRCYCCPLHSSAACLALSTIPEKTNAYYDLLY
jgi:hypothetical protein